MSIQIENRKKSKEERNREFMPQINVIVNKKMIKSILILEDDLTRIDWFHKTLDDEFKVTYTDYADTAKYLLNHNKYDLIFLDHDLGGKVYVSTADENTGSRVADEIEKLKLTTPTIIHSWNPAGVDYMANKIPHANPIPFGTFSIEIIN